MNYLWAFMILSGVIFSAFHGTIPAVTGAVLDSAKEAVTLCITMTGVMSFWMGLMRIAERGGVIAGLSRKLKPVLRFLFPQIPPGHVANEQIAANMIANIFGLGWAATPAGLKAMESLEELEESRRKEMGTENGAAKRKDPVYSDLLHHVFSFGCRMRNKLLYRDCRFCNFTVTDVCTIGFTVKSAYTVQLIIPMPVAELPAGSSSIPPAPRQALL